MDKVKLAYFTSLREIIGDERVSTVVIDGETGDNYGYRTGNLEAMALDIQDGQSDFAKAFEITMVFSDDSDAHMESVRPMVSRWPFEIEVPLNGSGSAGAMMPLESMLVRIPSDTWRKIRNKAQKAGQKELYEQQIITELKKRGVDLILSDSYLSLFADSILSEFDRRILNIHPAITDIKSPYRLPGLTPTRDAYTRARHGFIIVDDKKKPETWPKGPVVRINYNGVERGAVMVDQFGGTGVTVHVIDALVDHGPVVIADSHTFDPSTSYEGIREGNYRIKRELLPKALLEYVKRPEILSLIEAKRQEFQITGTNAPNYPKAS